MPSWRGTRTAPLLAFGFALHFFVVLSAWGRLEMLTRNKRRYTVCGDVGWGCGAFTCGLWRRPDHFTPSIGKDNPKACPEACVVLYQPTTTGLRLLLLQTPGLLLRRG